MKTNLRSLTLGSVALLLALLPGLPADADTILAQAPPAQGKAAPAPSPAPRPRSATSPPCSRHPPSRGSPRGRVRVGLPIRRRRRPCLCRAPRDRLPPTSSTSPTPWRRATRGAPSRSSSMAARARPPPSCTWVPWGRVPSTSRPTAPPRSSPSRSPTTPTPGSASPTWCSSIRSRPATAAAPPARRRPTAPTSASRRTRTRSPTSCGSTSRAQAVCWHRCSWWGRATAASARGWSPTSSSPVALASKAWCSSRRRSSSPCCATTPMRSCRRRWCCPRSQRRTSSCATARRGRSTSCPRSSASRARSISCTWRLASRTTPRWRPRSRAIRVSQPTSSAATTAASPCAPSRASTRSAATAC